MEGHTPPLAYIHFDADHFFCQVEAARRGVDLARTPVAVQQHQDTISICPKAKRLGVTKHMLPEEAKRLLLAAPGTPGRLLHVYTQPRSGRASYAPYLAASAKMMHAINRGLAQEATTAAAGHASLAAGLEPPAGWVGAAPSAGSSACVEVASIDECYCTIAHPDPVALARRVCAMCHAVTGIKISAGVATNKLMAKLASASAKWDTPAAARAAAASTAVPGGHPNVVACLDGQSIAALLAATPVQKLPSLGSRGKRSGLQALLASAGGAYGGGGGQTPGAHAAVGGAAGAGVRAGAAGSVAGADGVAAANIADLQQFTATALGRHLCASEGAEARERLALQLYEWCRGRDTREVVARQHKDSHGAYTSFLPPKGLENDYYRKQYAHRPEAFDKGIRAADDAAVTPFWRDMAEELVARLQQDVAATGRVPHASLPTVVPP